MSKSIQLPFFEKQSLTETIEVLDDVLYLLVAHADLLGSIPNQLVHQYLTIRELRDYFMLHREQGDELS